MRHQLQALGQAGYRAVAMDLRGCGASDKPPEGYALPMLARDVAGVITALGADKAAVVGHGLGGMVAWTMLSQAPSVLLGIAPIAAVHPGTRKPIRALVVSPRALAQIAALRMPKFTLSAARRGYLVGKLVTTWAEQPAWLDPYSLGLYQQVMAIPSAAERAAELMRLALRPRWRAAGRRFAASTRVRAQVPVLHIQGNMDHLLDYQAVAEPSFGGSDYHFACLDGIGHFPPEEAPEQVNQALLDWLPAVASS